MLRIWKSNQGWSRNNRSEIDLGSGFLETRLALQGGDGPWLQLWRKSSARYCADGVSVSNRKEPSINQNGRIQPFMLNSLWCVLKKMPPIFLGGIPSRISKATSPSIRTLWLLEIPEFNMSQIQHDHSPFFLHDVHYHWNGTLGPWPVQYGVLERLTASSWPFLHVGQHAFNLCHGGKVLGHLRQKKLVEIWSVMVDCESQQGKNDFCILLLQLFCTCKNL